MATESEKSPRENRFEIRLGASVDAIDGEVGRVDRLIVQPGSGDVTGLVVRKGLLLRRDIVIPIEAVDRADDQSVHLALTTDQVNALPEYTSEGFTNPPEGWRSTPDFDRERVLFAIPGPQAERGLESARVGQTEAAAGGRPIAVGQKVICRDGEVGKLDLVLVDRTSHRATYFVVRRGGLLGRDTIVPVEWVRDINPDRIFLDVSREQLNELPEYKPDDKLAEQVLNVLWYHSDLGLDELNGVGVQVHDGIVELNGYVRTEEAHAKIHAVIRKIPQVVGIRDRLQVFETMVKAGSSAQHLSVHGPVVKRIER